MESRHLPWRGSRHRESDARKVSKPTFRMLFHSGYTGYCLERIPPTVQNGVPHLLTAAAAQLRLQRVQGARRRPPGMGAAHTHGHPVCWPFPGAPGGGRKVCARLAPRVLRRHVLSSRTVSDICTPLPSKRGRRCQPDTWSQPSVLQASGYLA